jgi:DNA-binding CsgD family transcriptional regulator
VALLERESELEAVERAVETGGVVVVEGGAGIGKTSLLGAACDRAKRSGREVLRARGSELESGFAFGVVRQLFERVVSAADGDERSAMFAGPADSAQPLLFGQIGGFRATDTSFAVLHGLYWLAANIAARRPLVIAVDDAHWADAASLRWLAYLAPRLEGLALSLFVALRPAEPESEGAPLLAVRAAAAVLRPRALGLSAAALLARERLGAAASDALCASFWRASGGNPFYLRELLRAVDQGDRPSGQLDPNELLALGAEGVRRHVAGRLRHLDPRTLQLAQALAVLGDGCDLRHAATLAGLETGVASSLGAALVRLEVLGGIEPPVFLHPIVREAVEASLGSDGRDAAHRAAARLLHADDSPPGIVAAHLLHVRPAGDAWVLARLREAALAAIETGAPLAGAELLRRALAEPPSRSERVEVLSEVGRAEVLAGRESACIQFEDAMRLAEDPRARAAIGLELAQAHANLFHWVDAVDVCQQALAELGDRDPDLAAQLRAELVVCGLRDSRRAAQALPVLDQIATHRLEGSQAEAYAVARAIYAFWMAGQTAEQVAPPLWTAFDRAGPRTENWDARAPGLWILICAEGFDAAEATLNGQLAEVRHSGSARGLFVTYALLGLLKLRLGDLPEADAAARIALRVMRAADFAQGLPLGTFVLADTAIEAGQLDDAKILLDGLPHDGLAPGLGTVHVPAAWGRLRLAQGRPAEALAEFERGQAMMSRSTWGIDMHDNGFLHLRSGSARALLQLGEHERARELADSELADARVFAAPRALGIALRVAGLASGGERGMELLHESVGVLRKSPALLERAHSLAELGAALRRTGHRAAAREPLAEALDLAARCGARMLASRARAELNATGARPRSAWRTGVESLSPSELRVARLAADGRTNREIAQSLYVTVKTVEGHLARAYGKLNITGRDQLRQGLEGEKTRVPTR